MKLSYNDDKHAYWLDGKRCKGVTAVASYPDDKYPINQWRERSIVIGLARNPPLVHRAVAHFDERDKIQAIADEALVAAKAYEASGRGTADHRITERVDLGLDWIDTPEAQAIRAAWTAALDHADLEIDPALVERIVVYPDLLVAGRFDRIARYRRTGRPVVVDVKTGESAIKYPHSTAVQLALYANAPLMAGPTRRGQNGTEWTDTFEPLPDNLHRDHAIVVYLPPEGPAKPWRVNIARGWDDAAKAICFPTITWRKVDKADLIEPLDRELTTTPERVTWLRRRIQVLVDAGHEAAVAGLWDLKKVPAPITPDTVLTDPQVDLVVEWCAQVEAAIEAPFPDIDPLFAAFAHEEANEAPRVPPVESPMDGARGELARHWVDQAKELFEAYDLDDPTIRAVIAAAGMTGTETMTQDLYTRLASLVSQAHDVDGAVLFTYLDDGTLTITSADDAEARMAAVAGTRGEARDQAARLAKTMGRIAPRSLAKAAENPLLAALVAAGYGADTTTNEESITT